MKKLIPIIPILLLLSCGGSIRMIDEQQQAIVESQLPPMHPDGGQLCVCTTSGFGLSRAVTMEANGEHIGRLPGGSFFCVNLRPDDYIITANCPTCPRRTLETSIRQGRRRYMEISIGIEGMILQSVTQEQGLSCMARRMR